ncbi:hypothetical protein MCUN1_000942 [Malassezia cuniculi]|uniref:Mitochondrial intermembrane space cysteine motif-containing protein MIX17 n=1 Tax=Malassezia cuniculi TaxID=948313 RepID=A0AAF0J5I8_9BASI|nr:hypothetical protein MCUN1_000942 [Malassezia cuniculi]
MPRSSRSSGPRPAAPSRPAVNPAGTRGAHTMAAPPPSYAHPQQHAQTHQPSQPVHVQSSSGPGLFGQMASTAAGVAVGSTVGHGLSNMLFGGRSEPVPAAAAPQEYAQQSAPINCEVQSKEFLNCLEKTNDVNSCSYYLEQLKACQAAARPF